MKGTDAKRNIDIYTGIPPGWHILDGATTAPQGYRWLWNRESRFNGRYRTGLLREETKQYEDKDK